jgi:hypothetical protein
MRVDPVGAAAKSGMAVQNAVAAIACVAPTLAPPAAANAAADKAASLADALPARPAPAAARFALAEARGFAALTRAGASFALEPRSAN